MGRCATSGDRVALVVAETLEQAKAAAQMIEVEYEVLPAVIDIGDVTATGAAVHDEAADNRCFQWRIGDKEGVDAAIAAAAHVTRLTLRNNRLVPNAIEPRAANAVYNPSEDSYTLYVANQNPHVERLLMCAFVLGIPEHKMRVVAPDVGGGFGSKIFLYGEETALVWASKKLRRPIKWVAERSESFLTDAHGRDHLTTAELALDKDHKFIGFRVDTTANLGAYLSTFGSAVPTILYATLLAGQYATPKIVATVTSVFTNTSPVDAYRGAGRPEATYVVERMVETAAHELGIDPAELRRKNFITSFPHASPVGLTYDVGDYEATMARAIELADVKGFAARRQGIGSQGPETRSGLQRLHRGLRHRALQRGRCTRRTGRAVRSRRGPRPPHRQGDGLHRQPQPRPGPRDHLRTGGGRQARDPDRGHRHPARRHRQGAVRHGHLRQPFAGGRRHGDRQGARQGDRQRQEESPPT